jgi:hypothetical protein
MQNGRTANAATGKANTMNKRDIEKILDEAFKKVFGEAKD